MKNWVITWRNSNDINIHWSIPQCCWSLYRKYHNITNDLLYKKTYISSSLNCNSFELASQCFSNLVLFRCERCMCPGRDHDFKLEWMIQCVLHHNNPHRNVFVLYLVVNLHYVGGISIMAETFAVILNILKGPLWICCIFLFCMNYPQFVFWNQRNHQYKITVNTV